MKKKELLQYVCPECGSIHVTQMARVSLNNDNEIDFIEEDLFGEGVFDCNDCNSTFKEVKTKVLKCFNGRPRIQGYQVVNTISDGIHPDMGGSFCVYSLSQAKEMLGGAHWKLLTIYKGDIEEPTLMYEGKDPRK